MKVKSLGKSILLVVLLFLTIINSLKDVCKKLLWKIEEEKKDVSESCSDDGRGNACVCNEATIALEESYQQFNTLCPHKIPVGTSCSNLYKNGVRADGVYIIDPDGKGQFNVRCDMKTDLGGWTVLQRRMNGSVDFYRDWDDYKNGFGDLNGEFWLGLGKIHRLVISGNNALRVDLENYEGDESYAKYKEIQMSDEDDFYRLSRRSWSGGLEFLGDALHALPWGRFTTKDRDNDNWNDGNCAVKLRGGWWYIAWYHPCGPSNLNGEYQRNNSDVKSIYWGRFGSQYQPLKKAEMKLRPSNF